MQCKWDLLTVSSLSLQDLLEQKFPGREDLQLVEVKLKDKYNILNALTNMFSDSARCIMLNFLERANALYHKPPTLQVFDIVYNVLASTDPFLIRVSVWKSKIFYVKFSNRLLYILSVRNCRKFEIQKKPVKKTPCKMTGITKYFLILN